MKEDGRLADLNYCLAMSLSLTSEWVQRSRQARSRDTALVFTSRERERERSGSMKWLSLERPGREEQLDTNVTGKGACGGSSKWE